MKNTRTCPKCKNRKLWFVEHIAAKDTSVSIGGDMPLKLAVRRSTGPNSDASSFWNKTGAKTYDTGHFDAYVCATCGYTEFYARAFEALVHNPDDGVHFIDDE